MSTKSPLKKNDVARFQKTLETMRDKMTHVLHGTTSEVKRPDESTGYSQHQADQGTDDFDRRINLEVTGREFQILRQIERALEKIQDGTYGICDVTGDAIPLPRLEAMPYATMTVQAQEKLEKGLL